MPWIRLDDKITENDKIDQAGPIGAWMHVSAIAYCNRHLTDGVLPKRRVSRLSNFDWTDKGTVETPVKLVKLGLWHEQGHSCVECPDIEDDEYFIHGYGEFQPLREEVEAKRARDLERKKEQRAKADRGNAGKFVRKDSTRNPSGIQDESAQLSAVTQTEPKQNPSMKKTSSSSVGDEVEAVINLLADRALQRRVAEKGPVSSPTSWLRKVRVSIAAEHGSRIQELLDAPNKADVVYVADVVDGVRKPLRVIPEVKQCADCDRGQVWAENNTLGDCPTCYPKAG